MSDPRDEPRCDDCWYDSIPCRHCAQGIIHSLRAQVEKQRHCLDESKRTEEILRCDRNQAEVRTATALQQLAHGEGLYRESVQMYSKLQAEQDRLVIENNTLRSVLTAPLNAIGDEMLKCYLNQQEAARDRDCDPCTACGGSGFGRDQRRRGKDE